MEEEEEKNKDKKRGRKAGKIGEVKSEKDTQ